MITFLVTASWPVLRDMASSPAIAEAIDRHVEQQQHVIGTLRERYQHSRTDQRQLDTPPRDSLACSGLLSIADHILRLPSPAEVRAQLRPLLPESTRQTRYTPWGYLIQRLRSRCSDGLNDACDPLLVSFRRGEGTPRGRRLATHPATTLRLEHIPAFLPKPWYDQHFRHLGKINPAFLRRTVMLRLVQMISGGSLGDAAAFLGIVSGSRHGSVYAAAGTVHSWARQSPDPQAFNDSVLRILKIIEAAPNKVNYQRRRDALRHWSLDQDTWDSIVAQLPSTPGPVQPV
ncbi:hypothetical protein, partial [Nonomuraea sp. NPDC049028]|uniref:hypothetical protein n=1 Tax=Nonomuraea sp. NPDC049028 TaxID=3364348 RepID=UPI003715BCED